ncbi:NAD(P)-dependent methylenetetrahydromethanopterin dehydrogenase [Salinarimonas soli]|uniref:Methylenetetrahydromethanopterin dehydrogenase n=1 Tax=Salinarimonas soli TaxID=1638099 RepID=A0A5B2VGM9_9HYPH|nr:NAD(P)-dependent methylenetetrahydromethanopterin dehydrogenase [Salinarimonas soli]KAA2237499.1 methylenetetrahydromethanopterin dehydrogenase [Salinarimonas soli]
MARSILHMLSPQKHMSPFDVNMAVDAGFDAVVPYTGVTLEEVTPLVQDAIFSRSPQDGLRTGIFIAGKSAEAALDMADAARRALVPPFALHIFADPAGSFTTGAAAVAVIARALRRLDGAGLSGRRVALFGGTGVVAYCAAVLAAREGARPVLVGYDGPERVGRIAAGMRARFGVEVEAADGSTAEAKRAVARDADVILSAAAAGVQVLSAADLEGADRLLVAADVNAVPPAGIEGVGVQADGEPLGRGRAVGIGALAIGNVKYQTEAGLFRRMLAADEPLMLDFGEAFRLAVEIAG